MKKVVLLDDTQRKAFLEFCRSVENTENDKDKFLKAARLERHEAKPTLSARDIIKIIGIIGGMFIACILLILAYLSDNLFPAICGIVFLAFMIIVGILAN